ncbi:MAG: hypothetical protein VKJ06_03490 [Vampirovibrionales bacterium]|nr:hypothetical protein [Vampirovibrionales bacterium]
MQATPTPKKLKPTERQTLAQAVLTRYDAFFTTLGFFLVGVRAEYQAEALTLVFDIDKSDKNSPEGISLDDCYGATEKLLDAIEQDAELALLDFQVEVGSPGLFRELKTPRELTFYVGSPVKITVKKQTNSATKKQKGLKKPQPITGILSAYDDATQRIIIAADAPSAEANCNAGIAVNLEPGTLVTLNPVIRKLQPIE